jgi:hypothetical protein
MWAVSDMRGQDRWSRGIPNGQRRQAYPEAAFRYFLALERERSTGSGGPLLLLLVDLMEPLRVGSRIDATIARNVLSSLCRCLRETDIIGWYRQELVAGALLTELGTGFQMSSAALVAQRVRGELRERLPASVTRRLEVRVHQYPEPTRLDPGSSPSAFTSGEM